MTRTNIFLAVVCGLLLLVIAALLYNRVPAGSSVEQQRFDLEQRATAIEQQQMETCVAQFMARNKNEFSARFACQLLLKPK
jgi:hypothetical protein